MPECCVIGCTSKAEFGILSEGQSSDMETHTCEVHVGKLLELGVSKVYPI
ncbi:hypothetical protein [Desulfosporosinus fructosivorans]|nr:hypothetical protein [Desulfosporosinus fructosivorans]